MSAKKFMAALAIAGLGMSTVAQATVPVAGTLVSSQGGVLVSRDGNLLRATPSMALRSGDRVVTRAGGSAQLALNGCNIAVGASSMATVGGACGQTVGFTQASERSSSLGGGSVIVALLAAAAVIAAILIAVEGDDDDPISA